MARTALRGHMRETPVSRDLGQLFMVGFRGLTPPPGVLDLIERDGVGGIILFSRNCESARQVSRLTHDLQEAARAAGHRHPLLIAVDQENGAIHRLGAAITSLPGAMALGAARSEELTYAVARATGEELGALGINLNLAPVADINSNPANPVIGVRSFGQDPALVARMVAAAVHGYQGAGIAATLKHFPGHGDTAVDSHLALPALPHTRERLDAVELIPFHAGVAAGVGALMVAHLRLPGLAPDEDVPASLSPTVMRLAREALGFGGVIMTDCLEMAAVAKTVGVARGAYLALRAGADLALISHTLNAQREAIRQAQAALGNGELPEEIVRQALERMRTFKERFTAWERLPAIVERGSVTTRPHQRLSERAYRRAVTLLRDPARLIPVTAPPGARIALLVCAPEKVSQASDSAHTSKAIIGRARERLASATCALVGQGAGMVSVEDALALARNADAVILILPNAGRDPRQRQLARLLIATGRPLIAIAAGDPSGAEAVLEPGACLATYECAPAAIGAAIDAIFGVFKPRGRAPVAMAPPL